MITANKSFIKPMLTVAAGTTIGHLITAFALPIATRIYTPEDFSILSVFAAISAIISVVGCLRYDVAIPVASSKSESESLLFLSFMISFLLFVILSLSLILIPNQIYEKIGLGYLIDYLWLLPISIFMMSIFNALQYWHVREADFKIISFVNVFKSFSSSFSQILLGLSGIMPLGLLIGYCLNSISGALIFILSIFKKLSYKKFSRDRIKIAAKNHEKFPKYSAFEALFNTASIQAPIILIASFGIGPEAGYLMIAIYVMQIPMVLIGNAAGQVYYSQGAQENKKKSLADFNIQVLQKLSVSGLGPLVFIGIISPEAFKIVFGDGWERAGEMVRFMTPWFIMQFLTSPLSPSFMITGNQKLAMKLQIFGFFFRTLSVLLAAIMIPIYITEVYAITGFIFYLIYMVMIFVVTPAPINEILNSIFHKLWVLCALTLLGFISVYFIERFI